MSCAELQDENERLMLKAVDLHPQIPQGEEQREMDVALHAAASARPADTLKVAGSDERWAIGSPPSVATPY
jgi:hypothetical protein